MQNTQIEYLEKYASYADSLLSNQYGADYSAEDVEKLASALIDLDIEKTAEIEHVEYLTKCAQIQAQAFADEIIKTAGWEFFEKVAGRVAMLKNLQKKYKTAKKAIKAGAMKENGALHNMWKEHTFNKNTNTASSVLKNKPSAGQEKLVKKRIAQGRATKSKRLSGYNEGNGGKTFFKNRHGLSTDKSKDPRTAKQRFKDAFKSKDSNRFYKKSPKDRFEELKNSKTGTKYQRNQAYAKGRDFLRNEKTYEGTASKSTKQKIKEDKAFLNKSKKVYDKTTKWIKKNPRTAGAVSGGMGLGIGTGLGLAAFGSD